MDSSIIKVEGFTSVIRDERVKELIAGLNKLLRDLSIDAMVGV